MDRAFITYTNTAKCMMQQQGGQPIYILREGTERTTGRTAQMNNIGAAAAVANAVRTTLGPMGMDKMLVTGNGENVLITNDGATILREVDIDHPAAKLIIEVSKTQEKECYDGTTSAVVIAGELLKEAEGLLNQQIHPTIIAKGYRQASQIALDELSRLGFHAKHEHGDLLAVAKTALTGKSAEAAIDIIAEMCVKAVQNTTEVAQPFNLDNVKVLSFEGGTYDESTLLDGVLIEKERLQSSMPDEIADARVLLLMTPLEAKKTEKDINFNISDPKQLEELLKQEEDEIKGMVESIVATNANVVICNKAIDPLASHYLGKAGVYAIHRVKRSDMEMLSHLTGAPLCSDDYGYDSLAKCSIREVKYGDSRNTLISTEDGDRAATAILRGSTGHSVDEVERAFDDAIGVVGLAWNEGNLVAGGGAVQTWLAQHLRAKATEIGDRVGMAIEAFANALEIIPRTLAENAGLDPVDAILNLRKASSNKHGISTDGEVVDMLDLGVLEPRKVISNAIASATEASVMVLRIDDVISMKGGAPPTPDGMMG